jgi:hypothetical protein
MRRKLRRNGVFVATFSAIELTLLNGLLDELDELSSVESAEAGGPTARSEPSADPVIARLYPAGYADEADADEFRELTQTSLQQDRRDRYGQCRAELTLSRADAGELSIAPEDRQRWLMVLNDMRLALGTRLGVSAEGFANAVDRQEEAAQAAYHWLTAVQDELLTAALR